MKKKLFVIGLISVSQTTDFETYETAGSGAGFQALEAEVTTF